MRTIPDQRRLIATARKNSRSEYRVYERMRGTARCAEIRLFEDNGQREMASTARGLVISPEALSVIIDALAKIEEGL